MLLSFIVMEPGAGNDICFNLILTLKYYFNSDFRVDSSTNHSFGLISNVNNPGVN